MSLWTMISPVKWKPSFVVQPELTFTTNKTTFQRTEGHELLHCILYLCRYALFAIEFSFNSNEWFCRIAFLGNKISHLSILYNNTYKVTNTFSLESKCKLKYEKLLKRIKNERKRKSKMNKEPNIKLGAPSIYEFETEICFNSREI